MIKAQIFIKNDGDAYGKISVFIEIPAIPRIGEALWLTASDQKILKQSAKEVFKQDPSLEEDYELWFYGKDENRYLSFDDAETVHHIVYHSNDPVVWIILE